MKLIGISGTNGAGKDSIGEFLSARHHWLFVSVTEILRDELRREDLLIERHNLRELSARWRREFGHGVLIDKAVEAHKKDAKSYSGLVISSLRNPGEADEIHKLGGKVIWIDAEPEVRYKRISGRKRSSEDDKSFEEFLTEEEAEMSHSGDEATLSLRGVKERADIFINNNGDDLDSFYQQLEKALGL